MSERKMVLKLVEEGKMTAKQAEELLAKLEFADLLGAGSKVKALRIKMEECNTKKVLWEEKVPIAMVKLGLKLGGKVLHDAAKKYPDLYGFKINFREILDGFSKDDPGSIATLVSQDGSRQLHIWLE